MFGSAPTDDVAVKTFTENDVDVNNMMSFSGNFSENDVVVHVLLFAFIRLTVRIRVCKMNRIDCLCSLETLKHQPFKWETRLCRVSHLNHGPEGWDLLSPLNTSDRFFFSHTTAKLLSLASFPTGTVGPMIDSIYPTWAAMWDRVCRRWLNIGLCIGM